MRPFPFDARSERGISRCNLFRRVVTPINMTGRETIANEYRSTARRYDEDLFSYSQRDDAKHRATFLFFLNRPSTAVPYRRLSDLVASCVVALTHPFARRALPIELITYLVTIQHPSGALQVSPRQKVNRETRNKRMNFPFLLFFHL